MSNSTVEMLAGGPKPDFWREAIREQTGICGNCEDDDADVVFVERVDETAVLCEDCGELIPAERRTREYIRIADVPWGNPPAEIEDPTNSAEEFVVQFKNSNGKVWATKDADGDVVALITPGMVEDNSVARILEILDVALLKAMSGSTAHVGTSVLVDGKRFHLRMKIEAFPLEEISNEAAELFIESADGE
jgi:hypothetical protein